MSASDDEVVLVQPAKHAEDIVVPANAVRRRHRRGKPQGPKTLAVLLGKAGLCCTSDADYLQNLREDLGVPAFPDHPHSPQDEHAPIAVLGVVTFSWVFKGPVASKEQLLMHGRKRMQADPWGWLDHVVIDVCRFAHPQLIHNTTIDRCAMNALTLGNVLRHCGASVVGSFQDKHGIQVSGWHCVPLELGPLILGHQWPLLHSVPLLERQSKSARYLPFAKPKDFDIKHAHNEPRASRHSYSQPSPAVAPSIIHPSMIPIGCCFSWITQGVLRMCTPSQ